MAYLPRRIDPDFIYFVTSRTIDGALLLRPSAAVHDAIGAVLADAQARYGAELFDFVFLGNHMHLAVRCRSGQLPEFMQYLKSNIAFLVNRTLDRRGPLWERRYMASPILDEAAQIERAIYIYGHGVKEGLVARAPQWPGVASVKERLTGTRPTYERVDLAGMTRDRCDPHDRRAAAPYTRRVQVELSPWPFLAGLSPDEARAYVAELVGRAESRAADARRGAPPLGVNAVLAQDPRSRPHRRLQRRPNPLCHASSRHLRAEYRAGYDIFLSHYREASKAFRAGHLDTAFPMHSFPPPLPLSWERTTRAGPAVH